MRTSSNKLSEIMRKWRRRQKGQFAMYTKEGKKYVLPLYYLNHPIFQVLLEMAEEEFGLRGDGPLRVPCDEGLMNYITSLLRKNPTEEVENALVSLTSCRRASKDDLLASLHGHNNPGEIERTVL